MNFLTQIPFLIDDFGIANVRAAIIQYWAKYLGVEVDEFPPDFVTREYILEANNTDTSLVVTELEKSQYIPTIKDIERFFELTLDKEDRKSFGMVYTPDYIIDYLTKFSLDNAWRDRSKSPKICDPSCGSGGFLIRIAELLETNYGISGERAFSEVVFGIDIDKQALKQAQCLIELYLSSKKQRVPNLRNVLFELDTLTSKVDDIFARVGVEDGFDVIVTNPPYVKFQNLDNEYRQVLLNKYSGLANGNFSLSILFLVRGYELLSPTGMLGMIVQNNLFTSLAGQNVREYLQRHECIQRIINFSHHKVFSNASAYTCLIFLGNQKKQVFDFGIISDENELNLPSLEKLSLSKVNLNHLNPTKWRLGKDYQLENLKRIETIGKSLSEVAVIKVGFATLKDTVFFCREENGICFATSSGGGLIEIERAITRSAVKVSELKSLPDLQKNNRRIIFPYTKKNGSYKLIPERDFQQEFPMAYAYLLAFRAVLETRDKGKKQYENWYAWARSQGMDTPAPKLLTKTFSKFPQFFLDRTDQLFCNGYSVSSMPATLFEPSYPIEFLEKILNSKIMYYYVKLTSFQIEGNFQCYQKNFIEKFGVPGVDSSLVEEIIAMNQDEANSCLAKIYGISLDDIDEILTDG